MSRKIGKNPFAFILAGAMFLAVVIAGGVLADTVEDDVKVVPRRIHAAADLRSEPIWVSIREAVSSEGQLETDLFTPHEITEISRLLSHSPKSPGTSAQSLLEAKSSCSPTIVVGGHEREPQSVEELAKKSKLIFVGTVTAEEQGFFMGNAGSLVRIEADRQIKPLGRPENSISSFYAFNGYARFVIGEKLVCAGERKLESGAKALLFILDDRMVGGMPLSHQGLPVLLIGQNNFLKLAGDGRVDSPRNLIAYTAFHFDELVDSIVKLGSIEKPPASSKESGYE